MPYSLDDSAGLKVTPAGRHVLSRCMSEDFTGLEFAEALGLLPPPQPATSRAAPAMTTSRSRGARGLVGVADHRLGIHDPIEVIRRGTQCRCGVAQGRAFVVGLVRDLRCLVVADVRADRGHEHQRTAEVLVDLLPGELGALDAVATANHGPSSVAVQPCVVLVRQFEVERGQVGLQVLEREGSGDRDDDR